MADNIQVATGDGGPIRTDDIGSVHYPISKLCLGNDGTDDGYVSETNPIPVSYTQGFVDAFDRLRVSEPHTIFDIKHLHNKQPLLESENIVGSATSVHSQVDANITLSVNANNDKVTRQTRRRFDYQPGKSQLIYLTGTLGTGVADTKKCIGLFDDNNGLSFELNGTTLGVTIRKNGSDTTVEQSNWNVDKLDGTGASGITLDTTKTQIFVIDYEWLGVGRVRYGFVFNGSIVYCHYELHSNTDTTVYMSTPNLPARYEITSTGGVSSMTQICTTVITEGGNDNTGIIRSFSTGTTKLDADVINTHYAMLGLRLKSGEFDSMVDIDGMSILSTTKDDLMWTLCFNPTIAGTFTYGDINDSSLQGASGVTANAISDFGTILQQEYLSENNHISEEFINAISFGADVTGKADEIILAITPFSTNLDVYGSITYQEKL